MEVLECSIENFEGLDRYNHIFNSAKFIKLVSGKTSVVRILLFKLSKKTRLALVLGIDSQIGMSPFSAPFGGFVPFSHEITMAEIDQAIISLVKWLRVNSLVRLAITCPPDIYDQSFNSKIHNSLIRNSFIISRSELNFHLRTSDFQSPEAIRGILWRNGRKNLNLSLDYSLNFVKVSGEDKAVAYKVILQNRTEKGYDLKLSFSELLLTEGAIRIDYFIVYMNAEPVASAIVYHVGVNIVQVVYWGGLSNYQFLRPINFLAFKLCMYYLGMGVEIIDIGPSSINSIPDYGLCNFKESIGCKVSSRLTYTYEG